MRRILPGTLVRIMSIIMLSLPIAGRADAQSTSRSPRAFQGLFGPTETEKMRPRRLELLWSAYGAEDDNSFLTSDTDILDTELQARRGYSGATIAMTYTRRPPRQVLTVTAASAARYYPGLHRVVSTRYSGGVAVDMYPARNWRLQLSNSASFSPYYQVVLASPAPALGTVDLVLPGADYAVSKQHAMQYASFTGLTRTFSDRTALVLNYGLRYTQRFDVPDFNSHRAGGQLTHVFTKHIGLRLGYAYGIAATGAGPGVPSIRNSDLDIGLNYGRSFSPSTRTSFGFSSGSSIISSGDGRHFRVTGSGHVTRRLSPRWTLQATYDRGLQVPEGAPRPFFSDTVQGSLNGYVNRRVMVRVQPGFARGVVGFDGLTNDYRSLMSTSRIEAALTRELALYVEHFHYDYRFANGVGLPALLSAGMTRRGVRAGLTLWTPVVR